MKTIKISFKRVVIILLSLMLLLPAGAFAKSFDKIIAFGDSLSDHHGLEAYLGLYHPVNNPNGVLEAWTNGDVWVEYLADIMDATLDNNAIAGAMTDGHESEQIQALSDQGLLPQLGLVGQVNSFSNEDPVFVADETLFTIWIGGNDLLEYGRGESDATSVDALLNDAIDNVINSMSKLAGEGATHFLVLNLPDLGKTPAFNSRTPAEIAAATTLSFTYNTALETGLTNFKKSFPGITVYTFDVYTYMNQMISNGTFKNPTGTYMVLDENGDYTGAVNEPASDYLFWDSIHPTTSAHELVAINADKEIADTDKDNDDDDDDSCFIASASNPINHRVLTVMMLAVFSITGIAGWLRKND
ncbi:MAG: SGNH/GDSL hydrolase family protein [Desulfosalsimonadaceae bacterium]